MFEEAVFQHPTFSIWALDLMYFVFSWSLLSITVIPDLPYFIYSQYFK